MSQANAGPSDETLMAYADGEASPAEAREVEAAIAADPAVAERLALFSGTRAAAREAFPPQPVPDALKASVEAMIAARGGSGAASGGAANDAAAPAPPEGETIVPFRPRASARPRGRQALMAMAASVTAVAVAVGAFFAGSQVGGPSAPQGAGPGGVARLAALPLSKALTAPSGEAVTVGPGRTVRTVTTFRSGTGELCREFEVEGETRVLGVACRRDAQWSVDFAVATAPDPGGYVPASGTEALDAYLGTIAAQPPLGPQAETEALESIR
jgi:hypothetical protein